VKLSYRRKVCTKCGIEKSFRGFLRRTGNNKHLLRSWCKECSNKRAKERRANLSPKEKIKYKQEAMQWARLYRKKHPEYLQKHYGLGKYHYAGAKYAAKRRGCTFTLNKKQYYKLIKQPCIYCGKKIEDKGVGLDKINPRLKKYSLNNVVPCCKRCNWIKMDWFSFQGMKKIGKLIKTFKRSDYELFKQESGTWCI